MLSNIDIFVSSQYTGIVKYDKYDKYQFAINCAVD